ncbi:MAG: Polyprenol monophosphomannose synthase [Phycisphaerae bacterium]|nr:Polyprenol monophosphomannose synthase [Phycisphaerae bacterium]
MNNAEAPIRCSIVVPTYNERENLAPLARRVFASVLPADAELLIVDDNSPDGTADVAAALAAEYPVRCHVRHGQRGLATAVIAGMRAARGTRIVVMDADLSHPPEMIPTLLAALDADDVQMAIGSRFVPGGRVDLHWPLHRRLNSLLGRLLARPLTPVRDMMSGFFAVRRADVDLERLAPVGYKIALELIVRQHWTRVVELPISFSDRLAGKTKLSAAEQLRYLRHLARLYAYVLGGRRGGPR